MDINFETVEELKRFLRKKISKYSHLWDVAQNTGDKRRHGAKAKAFRDVLDYVNTNFKKNHQK